ncbi:MAG: hypothetical protein Q7T71_17815 [Herbiconiux sp.]|nr:hypothetical protein [Herbiconiux sp.]
MEWWNGFVRWLSTGDGEYVVSQLVLPALAIIVAGLLAAWIARSSVKRLLAKHDREQKVAAIAALIDAAEQASVWNSLTPQEQILSGRATGQADIQVRLLPIKGADVAANWAAHALAEMKRESATFGYQIEPAVIEFRDRLVEWQQKPGRAKRVFQSDLERWAVEDASAERELIAQQDAWVAQQHHAQYAAPGSESTGGGATAVVPAERPTSPSPAPTAIATPVIAAPAYDHTVETAAMATATIAPSVPLPPTHEPRPTVQQVASGTGSRGLTPSGSVKPQTERPASPPRDLDEPTDPGTGSGTDDVPPPVHAFPPRTSSE